ncbi:MAG: TerB family tellurite resistance protein [Deltaproteobacteria bacterium]|nr:TerB family tellurite resistance protein [Deltaproteobacteria bacterium]
MTSALDLAGKALTPALKETAFAWATFVVLADGWVAEDEMQFLKNLMERFKIQEEQAKKIIEVAQIVNRE